MKGSKLKLFLPVCGIAVVPFHNSKVQGFLIANPESFAAEKTVHLSILQPREPLTLHHLHKIPFQEQKDSVKKPRQIQLFGQRNVVLVITDAKAICHETAAAVNYV
jgi:hypothetical protein